MTESLKNRAKTIKGLIHQNLPNGADLLIDFARHYAVDKSLEDDIILAKLEYNEDLSVIDKAELIQKLDLIADTIVENYNKEEIDRIFEKERNLVQEFKEKESDNTVILTAKNIEKNYKKSKFHLHLDQLEIRLGEITGLIGENATGKTTLLRILAGNLATDKGKLTYPNFSKKAKLDWWAIKKQIAYVPQELPVWTGSLKMNLKYEAASRGIKGKENEAAVEYILQRLGLAPHIDKTWAELSGGYKLRFSLAKALVWSPQFLIIDEPLANLDIKTQITVLKDLQNLSKSLYQPIAILISSQHLHEIEAIADQMLFMRDGQLDHLGNTADFRNNRKENVFEIGCPLSYTELIQEMVGFPYKKIIFTGLDYLVITQTNVKGYDLLSFLAKNDTPLLHFRDISQSIKTKFYEKDIE